jgi:hypothetical protein
LDASVKVLLVVTVDTAGEVVAAPGSELVGVKVEVDTMTVTDCEVELALWVMVEDSVTTEGDADVGDEVGELVGELVSAEVGEDVASDEVSEPPVDSCTLWRFSRAMASSSGSAVTADAAKSMLNRRTPSFCIVNSGGDSRSNNVCPKVLGMEVRLTSVVKYGGVCALKQGNSVFGCSKEE